MKKESFFFLSTRFIFSHTGSSQFSHSTQTAVTRSLLEKQAVILTFLNRMQRRSLPLYGSQTQMSSFTLKHHKKDTFNICAEAVICTFSPSHEPFLSSSSSSSSFPAARVQVSKTVPIQPNLSPRCKLCSKALSCPLARPCWTSRRRPLAVPSHRVGSSRVGLKCSAS